MKYHKLPHSRLHHVETHRHDDGSYRVEAHVIHHPPHPDGKKIEHMAYASPHEEYPNRIMRHGAEDMEEANEIHADILAAHHHDRGMRAVKREEGAEEAHEEMEHEEEEPA